MPLILFLASYIFLTSFVATRRGKASRDARVGIGAKTGCRKADTLRYTDAEGRKMEIKGITDSNYSDVMAHYHAGNYTHLRALAL